MRKINILHIIATMDVGGAERQLIELVKRLDRNKYNSLVCCLTRRGPLLKEIEKEGIKAMILKKKFKLDISVFFKLVKLMKKENIDIVHTWMFTSNAWGRIAARFAGVPVIAAERCMVTPFKGWMQRLVDKALIGWTDTIIAVSESVRMSHIKEEGIPPPKIMTIPNGVDTEKFNPRLFNIERQRKSLGLEKSTPVVGIIGWLVKGKGYEYFLKSSVEVLQSKPARFLIVGDGPLRPKLERMANELGISNEVLFAGYREDILEIFSVMNILVISSLSEGLSNVLLEGMAMAKPIVATNIPSNAGVINNGKDGMLVPPANSAALAKGILYLLNNPGFALAMGKEARILVEKEYSAIGNKERMENLYDNLVRVKLKFFKCS